MEKQEIISNLKSVGLWNRYRNEYWWQKAFEAYNVANGSKLKPNCGVCFTKVKEWLNK